MKILAAFLVKVSVCFSVSFIFAVFIKSELRAIPRSLGRQTETFGKSKELIFLVVTLLVNGESAQWEKEPWMR